MALTMTITDTGWAKMLDADAQGLTLSLNEVGLGAGTYAVNPAANALAIERERVAITDGEVDAAAKRLSLNLVLQSAAAYDINEVGLFDTDGDMIFVWAAAPGEGPLTAKTAQTKLAMGFAVVLDQAPADVIEIIDEGQDLTLLVPNCRWSVAMLASEALRGAAIEIQTRFNEQEVVPL